MARPRMNVVDIANKAREALQSIGIDPTFVYQEWQKGQEKTKQRLEDVAPLLNHVIAMKKPYFRELFPILNRRRIPTILRQMQQVGGIDVDRGLDENMAIIGLAKMCALPSQISSPLEASQKQQYFADIEETLFEIEEQLQKGTLTEEEFNAQLDFAIKDEFHDAFRDFMVLVKKYAPEFAKKIGCEIDKVLVDSGIVAWADNFARPKPKQKEKGVKAFLQRHGVL